MARGSQVAQNAANSAYGFSNALQGNAGALYSTLAPQLESQLINPTGFTPTEKAQMRTASQQSLGGSQAGAVGQGALLAGRTKNAGTADAAIQEAARSGGRELSKAALGTELEDAALKRQNQRFAEGELGSLYGTQIGGANTANRNVAENVNANTNAVNASWDWAKFVMDPLLSAASGAAPTIGKAFGAGG